MWTVTSVQSFFMQILFKQVCNFEIVQIRKCRMCIAFDSQFGQGEHPDIAAAFPEGFGKLFCPYAGESPDVHIENRARFGGDILSLIHI